MPAPRRAPADARAAPAAPAPVRRSTETFTLAPVDNRALANLCGPLDANLRQIEAALDVTISRRGAPAMAKSAPRWEMATSSAASI